jgi:Na+/H+ antiporter NhaD/arsenite permease-like protein
MKWMVIPAVVACVAAYVILRYWVFRSQLKEVALQDMHFDMDEYRLHSREVKLMKGTLFLVALMMFSLSDVLGLRLWIISCAAGLVFLLMDIVLDMLRKHGKSQKHEGWITIVNFKRLPFPVAPFMVGMFSLVYALDSTGWISWLATILGSICTSMAFTVYFVAVLMVVACSLANNQPATILLSRVFLHPAFTDSLLIRRSAMFSLILGSNFGANFSVQASMAGLMFMAILDHYNVSLPARAFSKYGLQSMTWVVLISASALAIELSIY